MNIIPKSLTKQKLVIYHNFTLVDLALAIVFCGVAFGIAYGLTSLKVPTIGVVVVGVVIFGFFCISLFTSPKHHRKYYLVLILMVRFFFSVRKYSATSKETNSILLIPYKRLVGDLIETKRLAGGIKWYICGLELKGFNISNLSEEEQELKLGQLKDLVKGIDINFSIIKIDQPLRLKQNILHLKKQFLKIKNHPSLSKEAKRSRLLQIAAWHNDLIEQEKLLGQTSKRFYLLLYHTKANEIVRYSSQIIARSIGTGLKVYNLSGYQLVNTIKAIFEPLDRPFTRDEISSNADSLDELFALNEMTIYRDHIDGGAVKFSVHGIFDYPLFPGNGWAASVCDTESTVVWNMNNTGTFEIKRNLHKALINAKVNLLGTKQSVDKAAQNYQIEVFDELIDGIASGAEAVKKCNMLFYNYGADLKDLKQQEANLKNILKNLEIDVHELNYMQFDAFSGLLPKPTDPIMNELGREIPTSTIAYSFPFINNDLNDSKGIFLGFNTTGDLINFDQFTENFERKNFNELLLGTSGSGKSYTAKKQANYHIAMGRKVIIIDPEREYKELCEYHDGNWIDVGSGTKGRINPLQILDNAEDAINNDVLISGHLQFLEEFFNILIPDLSSDGNRYLSQSIFNLYVEMGIVKKDLHKLKNTDYPTFEDLLRYWAAQPQKDEVLRELISIFATDFTANGKYAQLYNGHSTLDLEKNLFTVFDINALFEKGNPKIIQAQLYLSLAYIENSARINYEKQNNEMIVLVDEAHLIIDKDNPVGLNFMFKMVKRIRKKKGGIIIITQNPDDFLGSEEIRKKTMAMMNNTQYIFVLNLSPQNLTDVMELFKSYGGLSDEERMFIAKAQRGQALFVVNGFNRHTLQIQVSDTEQAAFKNIMTDEVIRLED